MGPAGKNSPTNLGLANQQGKMAAISWHGPGSALPTPRAPHSGHANTALSEPVLAARGGT